MKKSNILLLFSLLMLVNLNGQSGGDNLETLKNDFRSISFYQITQKDSLGLWQEQVLLHLDSESYRPQQDLFFKAYVLTGPKELRVSASDVLRIELLDSEGSLITQQYHQIQGGSASGVLELSKKLEDGYYYIRAYTRWMLNYGAESLSLKKISIAKGDLDNKELIVVHPESGHFISGFENKAVVSNQSGNTVAGKIVDETGKEITNLVNYEDGLATFSFSPKAGESYYFQGSSGYQLELPKALEEGIILQANNIDSQNIKVRVGATEALLEGTYQLRGSKNNRTIFETEINFEKTSEFVELEIPKDGLPNGLLNLDVVDQFDQVWAERPVLVNRNELNFTAEEEVYNSEKGKKLKYEVKVTDDKGQPVSTELLVSIIKTDGASNMIFEENGKRSENYLNDLKVIAKRPLEGIGVGIEKEIPDEIKYTFQKGLEFYGQAYDLNNKLLANQEIQVLINNESRAEVKEVSTNSNGLFSLTGLKFEGEITLTFRTKGEDIKEKLVKVIPYEYELPELKINKEQTLSVLETNSKSNQLIPKKRLSDFGDEDQSLKLIALDEVALIGKKKLSKSAPSVYNLTPSKVIYQDPERPKTIPELFLGSGALVNRLGDFANVSVSLPASYGFGPVLWVIDGIPQNQTYRSGSDIPSVSPLVRVMDVVTSEDVERIELLRAVDAGIYGSRASGGVILVYTRSGAYATDFVARKDAQLKFQGFQESIDFQEYWALTSSEGSKNEKMDPLYWNPNLKTDQNGEATIEILVPKETDNVLLDMKVITEEGKKATSKTLSRF